MSAKAHDSAAKHVSGTALFVDDSVDQSYKHIALGCSTIACGSIESIDLTSVAGCDGVIDIITVDDIPGHTDIGPVFDGDPLLTSDRIEFFGQAVFAVLANTQAQARYAVRQANITYKKEPAVLTLAEAIEKKFYVRPPHSMQRGDAAAHLDSGAHRLNGKVSVGGQEHFYLEGQVATAFVDEDEGVHILSSNQNPTEAQKLVAEVLGLSMKDVLLETRRLGGGFGGKETQANACCCFAALFAKRNRCKTVCRLSRRDDMITTGKRHEFINEYDVSFEKDGSVNALRFSLAGNCGSSPDLSDAIVDRAMFHSDNAYFYPHILIDGLRCKTNTVSNTAFRGFGGPQGMLAAETVMDEIAFALQMDPLDVRKQNFYGHEQSGDDRSPDERNVTPYHQTIEHFTVPALVEQLEVTSDYRNRRAQIREYNRGTEMGQGLFVKVAQVVSAELGVPLDAIKISSTRTDKVPNTSATAASSGSDLNGMAALYAARKIKARLLAHVVDEHQCDESEVSFAADGVSISGSAVMSWSALAHSAWMARISLSATGFYKTPEIYYDRDKSRW